MLLTPEKLQETIALLYHASFVEHRDVVDQDTLSTLLARVHGEEEAKKIIIKVESHIQVKKKKPEYKLTNCIEYYRRSEEDVIGQH